jgi:PKD repeat protein
LPLNSDKTFNLSHAYSTTGNYPVTVSVSDANGLTGSSHFVVTVVQPSSGLVPVPDAFVTTLYSLASPVLPIIPEGDQGGTPW